MKRALPFLASAALFVVAPAAHAAVPFIRADVKKAFDKAKAEKRPLMVDVFATWCGPCKELDAKVFSTAAAEKALNGYVALKVDAESGEGPQFIERYHVVGYPTVLFLDSDGREIDRIFGSMPLEEFLRTAKDYASGKGTLADEEKKFLETRACDLELASELLFRHAVKGDEEKVKTYQAMLETARLAFAVRDGATPESKAVAARLTSLAAQGRYVTGKYLYLRGRKDFAAARDTFLALRREFPGTEQAHAALFDLAWAYDGLKDAAKTRAVLDEYLSTASDEAEAANAYAWFCFKHDFDAERGIAVATAALQKQPKADELWDTLAELYAKRGERTKAVEAEERALSAKPKDAYYAAQKKKFEAK